MLKLPESRFQRSKKALPDRLDAGAEGQVSSDMYRFVSFLQRQQQVGRSSVQTQEGGVEFHTFERRQRCFNGDALYKNTCVWETM